MMKIEMFLSNSVTKKIYDISSLCTTIAYDSYLHDQPGKLTFTLQKDPNGILDIKNGSAVSFKVDDYGVFAGYVFTMGTDATGSYKITCYDQLRYFKNPEYYTTKNISASQIFELICVEGQITNYEIRWPTTFIIPIYLHDKKTRYEIIQHGINQHLILFKKTIVKDGISKEVREKCFIRDDFGTLIFSELEQEKSNYIIGNESMLMNYTYEISIDSDTYNEIQVIQEDKKTKGKREVYTTPKSNTRDQWGQLRMMQEAKKEMNEAQIREMAENLLSLKNRETKTMKLNALGIKEFRAGTGFVLDLPQINVKEWMWIESVTHTFQNDFHTMEMEVFIV